MHAVYRIWSWAVTGELVDEILASASILTGFVQALIDVILTESSIVACYTFTLVATNQVLDEEKYNYSLAI